MKDKVCAVVVTYNRKNLLLECLEALKKQTRPLQGIYLIDNASTDGTPELLLEWGYINEMPPHDLDIPWEREFTIQNLTDGGAIRFHYVRMDKNTGGAGGFHEGVKRAFEKGYDWFWLMDDDSEPAVNALEKFEAYFDGKALASLVKLPDGTTSLNTGFIVRNKTFLIITPLKETELYSPDFLSIDVAPFLGFLVNRGIVEKIGFPEKNFYIYYDDGEYCLRIRKVAKIILVKEAILIHKVKRPERNVNPYVCKSLWRHYFAERNKAIVRKRYIPSKIALFLWLVGHFFSLNLKVLTFWKAGYPWKEAKLLYYSFIDAIRENYNRRI
uniref:Glycosyltransferase n=2 Tax=Bacteria TaxID=2 RepID=A0A7C2P364_UNCW3